MGNKVLALDLSTKRSGYATRVNGELVFGAISDSSTKVEKRIIKMRDAIGKLITEYDIDTIIVEEVRPTGANAHTGKVLNWLQGVIAIKAYEINPKIKIEFIGPSSWRSKIGIQGYRIKRDEQKKKDIEYVRERYGITTLDDEADAIGILDAYEIEHKPLSQVQEAAAAAGFDFGWINE